MNYEILLKKPLWTNKDIREYVGCGTTKASAIRQKAIMEFDGLPTVMKRMVYRDSVLKTLKLEGESMYDYKVRN